MWKLRMEMAQETQEQSLSGRVRSISEPFGIFQKLKGHCATAAHHEKAFGTADSPGIKT